MAFSSQQTLSLSLVPMEMIFKSMEMISETY